MSHPTSSPPSAFTKSVGPTSSEVGTLTRLDRLQDEPCRLDLWADWCVRRVLPSGTGLLCLAMFASWVPHYLTWPWWPDLDTNAAMALAWSQGVLPYRDVAAFAFPGQILLFRGLIAVFGPGKSWPIYALDAAMVCGLGLVLVLWSRRHFHRSWPGLVSFTALLGYLANLNFSLVAQRDWQAMWFIALALLSPTTWPGRWGRTASAFATAAAFAFRPHVIVFVPALLWAVAESSRGERLSSAVRWVLLVGCGVVLAFLPLIIQGNFDDFLRGIRLASYGSRYNRATPTGMIGGVIRQVTELRWLAVPLVVGLLSRSSSPTIQRESRIWLLAAIGVLAYKPLHPFPHDYLDHPRWVVWSVMLGLLAANVLCQRRLSGQLRLALSVIVVAAAVPAKPAFCDPRAALAAIVDREDDQVSAPPGYVHHMTAYQEKLYPWVDYRNAIDHLRNEFGASTKVANLLSYQLSAVGVAGRLPVFRNESGLLWKSQVGWDDCVFLDQLETTVDSVVIWSPNVEGPEPDLISPAMIEAVHRWYEPDRSFGKIEVWKRKGDIGTNRSK
ncbi:hypothetical protein [Tautonia rosea]|uniref:hypothetical protein n=1 Tax=Tautonia rosea TaxID=2728037 RepID=UPI0014739781|nr:hypothetical protein [Tautonia rosea]